MYRRQRTDRRATGRRLAAAAIGAGAATIAAGAAWAIANVRPAMGASARGPRDQRVLDSPQYRDGAFRNSVPGAPVPAGRGRQMLRDLAHAGSQRRPARPVPVVIPPPASEPEAADGLRVTWYGHSSALVEIDTRRVLFDPVWSERCSPSSLVGPRRLHPAPVTLDGLPRLDAILISHDHYDHLDMPTVVALARSQACPFLVPLGVGAHLEHWGIARDRILELDWSESVTVAGLRFVATAARHFSGRGLVRDQSLWASWVVAGPHHRVFYSGDSGYFDGYARIGAEHGPFDAALIQIGAYGDAWPDIHMTPEEAVAAHRDVRGGLLIPVHWGTFVLAFHDWSAPVDRLWQEAKAREVRVAVPRPGERVDVDDPPEVDGWWQAVA